MAVQRPTPIDRQRTGEQVADALRQMLLTGELQPGDRLREAELAAALNVSRGSVREGLQALITEGLVQHEIHRGAVVRVLSEDDVKEIQGIRRLIETAAIRAADTAPKQRWDQLENALEAFRSASEDGDWLAASSSDLEFHRALVGLLDKRRLDELSEAMHRELHLILALTAESRYPAPKTLLPEHEELLELIRSGKLEDATKLLADHLTAAENNYIRTIHEAHSPSS